MKPSGAKFFSIVVWLGIALLAAGLAVSSWMIYADYKGAAEDSVAQHKRIIIDLAGGDEGEIINATATAKQQPPQEAAKPADELPAIAENPAPATPPATGQAQGGSAAVEPPAAAANGGSGGEQPAQTAAQPGESQKPEPAAAAAQPAAEAAIAATSAPSPEPATKPEAPEPAKPEAPAAAAAASPAPAPAPAQTEGQAGKEQAPAAEAKTETKQARIAVIMTGMGLSKSSTVEAMKLPQAISFSFSPYSASLNEWFQIAKANGNEILMDLPMEPNDYPITDPGPYALLTSLSKDENLTRLKSLLSLAGESLSGLVASRDEKFSSSIDNMAAILPEIKAHGLRLYFATKNSSSPVFAFSNSFDVPVFASDVIIDEKITESAIREKLADLEKIALSKGSAIAIARPYPLTVKELEQWGAGLAAKGIKLVPVSAIGSGEIKNSQKGGQ